MQNEQLTQQQPKIIPLSKFNDFFEYPKVSTLRQFVFHNTLNFKNDVLRILGKRLYVDVEAFSIWVNKQKTGGENA